MLRDMRRVGSSSVAAVVAVAATAVVLAEDFSAETGSTLEASSVQSAGTSNANSSAGDGGDTSWRGAGFGESPGQLITMILTITFTSALAIAWICCRVFRAGGDNKPVCTLILSPPATAQHPIACNTLKLAGCRRSAVHRIPRFMFQS
eukprot:COSAG02_NODE_1901_length_10451_cov_44.668566_6_plen_148_part_00